MTRRSNLLHSKIKPVSLAMGLILSSKLAIAGNIYWNTNLGDWYSTGNWDTSLLPSSSDVMNINNGGTATISTPGAIADKLVVGNNSLGNKIVVTDSGTLTLDSGSKAASFFGQQASGLGTLSIENGGDVYLNGDTIFFGFFGKGNLTVSGIGSTLNGTSIINIGSGGSALGTMMVTDGGSVNSGSVAIGNDAGSNGSLTIDGDGSSLIMSQTPAGIMYIGSSGTARVDISAGGHISGDGSAIIGNANASRGEVYINGADSLLNITGDITLANGVGSIGILTIGTQMGVTPVAAPGQLSANKIKFGSGAGTLSFNHTETAYIFNTNIDGTGTINLFSGATRLSGTRTNSGTSSLQVHGGTLLTVATDVLETGRFTLLGGATGGTLQITIDDDTTFSKVIADTIQLDSGAKIAINLSDPNFKFTSALTNGMADVISAGTLTSDGKFSVSDNSVLFDFIAVKDGNTVDLALERTIQDSCDSPVVGSIAGPCGLGDGYTASAIEITSTGSIHTGSVGVGMYDNATTVTNGGTVEGTNQGVVIAEGATVGGITNSGTIRGVIAIQVGAGATLSSGITNTGLLDGAVALGGATLNLNGRSARVTGAVSGSAATVNINDIFTTEATFDVDRLNVLSEAVLNQAHAITVGLGGVRVSGTHVVSTSQQAIHGDYTLNDGATLRTDVNDDSTYGTLVVSGTATLPSAANIQVNVADPNFNFTDALTNGMADVISAGTLTSDGTFSVSDNSLLFDFTAVKDGNTVDLSLKRVLSVFDANRTVANSPAYGSAGVLDTVIADPTLSSNPNWAVVIDTLGAMRTEQEVANAVNQTLPLLTGGSQIAASAALTGINRVVQARQEANHGLNSGDAFYGDRRVWMKPFGSWTDQSDRNAVTGYKAHTRGLAFGVDGTVSDTTRWGASFAYANSSISGNSTIAPNNAKVDVYQLVGYGSHAFDPYTELRFQVGVGRNQNHGSRRLDAFGLVAKADYNSLTYTAGVGLGRIYKQSETVSFTPSVRVDYTRVEDGSYTETGANALNLIVNSRSTEELILSMDGKLTRELANGAILSANLGLGYDTMNAQASITSAFAGAPTASFTTLGLDASPWMLRGGVGLSRTIKSGLEVLARYDMEYRESFLNQTASIKLRWAF